MTKITCGYCKKEIQEGSKICSYCGKKFKMVEGQEKTKPEIMNKESYWKGIVIFIIGYLLFAYFLGFFPFDNTSIKDCVSDCVSDHDFCVSMTSEFSQSGTEYILYNDYQDCFDDLDMCVSDCE